MMMSFIAFDGVPEALLNFAFCLNYRGSSNGQAGSTDEKFTGVSLELPLPPPPPSSSSCVQRLLLVERLATRACLTVDFSLCD